MENTFVDILPATKGTSPTPRLVLTRYLYVKEDVLASLCFAILDKQSDEAIFWACELYYSGFEKDVADYVMAIYRELFRPLNPRLEPFLETMRASWNEGAEYVATMVRNLASPARSYDVSWFVSRETNPPIGTIRDRKLFVHVRAADVEKYKTIDCVQGELRPWQVLDRACIYSVRRYGMELFECIHRPEEANDWDELVETHRKQWVYYASFSPIWARRIAKYGGTICHDTQCVLFDEDENEEAWYDEYGYDLDEQPLKVHQNLGLIDPVEQMTVQEFSRFYSGKGKTNPLI